MFWLPLRQATSYAQRLRPVSLTVDETRFLAALGMVGMMYPKDVFPPDGTSQDCKSAKMVRLTLENVWKEYEKLKDAEAVPFGCHCDLDNMPEGYKPDDCVMDYGDHDSCVYARQLVREGKPKTACIYWQPIKQQAIPDGEG